MNNVEKIYTGLCITFTALLIVGNVTYQKFVVLPIPFYHLELSVGAILYPLTFLLTDLIAEFYGKVKATFCIRFAIVINIIIALIIGLMDCLPATSWSKINDETFYQVFGGFRIAFAASITACYIAQALDVYLYLGISRLTKGKYLWLRSTGSTSISLLLDTTIVISFMSLFNILPQEHMGKLIINSYFWKLSFVICSTPLFYLGIFTIKYLSHPQRGK